MQRHGFTLVELLVATAVFTAGFLAAFSLFLAGTRARTKADDLTHLAFATTTIAEEIALGMPTISTSTLNNYLPTGGLITDDPDARLYSYPGIPGIWFRVEDSQPAFFRSADPSRLPDQCPAVRLTLFVYRDTRISGSSTSAFLEKDDLLVINRRAGLVRGWNDYEDDLRADDLRLPDETTSTKAKDAFLNRLVAASLAVRQEIIVPRN